MLIIRQKMIYRQDLRNNPGVLYIFGDNLDRQGMGGQAAEMRGEPNAFGIATKRSISHSYPNDYFFDHQEDVFAIIRKEFEDLENFLLEGEVEYADAGGYDLIPKWKAVVIPADGLGTGLSKMPEYAPKALEYLNNELEKLKEI